MKRSHISVPAMAIVLVDGNNVMGSRADGWWRNRAEAALRLVDDIAPVARAHGGEWTIVFDAPRPTGLWPHDCVAVLHAGHRRRDAADDRIVDLVHSLACPATALVYTSDARLRARVNALGARVAGARALLDEMAAMRNATKPDGSVPTSRIEPRHIVSGNAGVSGGPAPETAARHRET